MEGHGESCATHFLFFQYDALQRHNISITGHGEHAVIKTS